MNKKKQDTKSFEYNFKKLEEILDKFENSIEEYSLDEILENYQEGLKLLKICRDKLKDAELKIEKINLESKN
ncbi:MAG TPA: exodeoxyribonuclease VII small subunit [Ignavibacteria bacterium]|jgi:exodeoxyribonuclease VII small subunit